MSPNRELCGKHRDTTLRLARPTAFHIRLPESKPKRTCRTDAGYSACRIIDLPVRHLLALLIARMKICGRVVYEGIRFPCDAYCWLGQTTRMATFNVLHASIACPRCGVEVETNVNCYFSWTGQ